ncbi:hypothetical protein OUZ56_029610 [Daphnia magna]|uniref:Uncharacterized protein n=1 Tax=Daphnia magna TaxID=35525 RepID=A0ABR0B7C7_9CRUS|nr:hypothetical protein OUZ56_029610 [Daphnia magna]
MNVIRYFPLRNTTIQNLVGCFGGNGSALALHKAMTSHIDKNSQGETFEPLAYLIPRVNCVYLPGIDKVMIVFYKFSALTVKASNLISFILDFVEIKIQPKDIMFVAYGNATKNKATIFAPIVVKGDEMLNALVDHQSTAWLETMKWGCFARMFPTTNCRNRGRKCIQNVTDEDISEEDDEDIE